MGIEKLLFSFHGRIDRMTWWVLSFAISFMGVIVFYTFKMTLGVVTASLVMVPVYWSTFALNAKRLHDRGASGWWQGIPGVAMVLVTIGATVMALGKTDASLMQTGIIVALAGVAIGLWGFWITIQIMFLRGSFGANDFGPPSRGLAEMFSPVADVPAFAASDVAAVPYAATTTSKIPAAGGGLPRRVRPADTGGRSSGGAVVAGGRAAFGRRG